MAQAGKGRLNYRCPTCFQRDLDIDMFYDKDKGEYYCLRCQFTGSEQSVLAGNEVIRMRYKALNTRYRSFNFDVD